MHPVVLIAIVVAFAGQELGFDYLAMRMPRNGMTVSNSTQPGTLRTLPREVAGPPPIGSVYVRGPFSKGPFSARSSSIRVSASSWPFLARMRWTPSQIARLRSCFSTGASARLRGNRRGGR